jgi:hypothetical protein
MPLDRKSKRFKTFNEKRLALLSKKLLEGLSKREERQLEECTCLVTDALPPVITPEMWQKLRELELHVQDMVVRNKKLKKSG